MASEFHQPTELPLSLRRKLRGFRQRLWWSKIAAYVLATLTGAITVVLGLFSLDRLSDTSAIATWIFFFMLCAVGMLLPWCAYHWIWKYRSLEQLARLLRKRNARIGDRLLGVIELSRDASEQFSSPRLREAAILQVDESTSRTELNQAGPTSHVRFWLVGSLCLSGIALCLFFFAPQGFSNSFLRATAPWLGLERYCFTHLKPVAPSMFVAHNESFPVVAELEKHSPWSPAKATVSGIGNLKQESQREASTYKFELPPLAEETRIRLRVGDAFESITIQPKTRPEIHSIAATIRLPDYLQTDSQPKVDLRSGILTLLEGAQANIVAKSDRELRRAWIEDSTITTPESAVSEIAVSEIAASALAVHKNQLRASITVPLSGDTGVDVQSAAPSEMNAMHSSVRSLSNETVIDFRWEDIFGLRPRDPYRLLVQSIPDKKPSVTTQELASQVIIHESEQLNFPVFAADDFGIRRVGLRWKEFTAGGPDEVAEWTDYVLAVGAPNQATMQLAGTLSSSQLEIPPQAIVMQLWAEDFHPSHGRGYGAEHLIFILNQAQHAVWIADQLNKWHRQSLEIRDQELQLYAQNQQLREMSEAELKSEEVQRRIQSQANAERTNARRLESLASSGRELIRQATRNPSLSADYLAQWQSMLETLDGIAQQRMPTVEDLLRKSLELSQIAPTDSVSEKTVGQMRASNGQISSDSQSDAANNPDKNETPAEENDPVPQLTDIESSANSKDAAKDANPKTKTKDEQSQQSRLSLPSTTLVGPANRQASDDSPTVKQTTEQAVSEQKNLLAEFEKISDELNDALANLEGSTLVKRLKAESRTQNRVAEQLAAQITETFGQRKTEPDIAKSLDELSGEASSSSKSVSNIMDDIEAYAVRRKVDAFDQVLQQMRNSDVISALRSLSQDLGGEHGLSMAQAEYWADTLDRWAEDLVEPSSGGQEADESQSKDSLPPSLALDFLKILEAEVDLRERTRVVEQKRADEPISRQQQFADELAASQEAIEIQTLAVAADLMKREKAGANFEQEISLLGKVAEVMGDAKKLLSAGNTGPKSIAAETEAIELMLQSKRINPQGGGGSGASPGGGGKGETIESAMALRGIGRNPQAEERESTLQQATGIAGDSLPSEFRAGLDQFLNRLGETE